MIFFNICPIFCVGVCERIVVTTLEEQTKVYKAIFEKAKIPYPSLNFFQTKHFKIPKKYPTSRDILALERKSIVENDYVPPLLTYSDRPSNLFIWGNMQLKNNGLFYPCLQNIPNSSPSSFDHSSPLASSCKSYPRSILRSPYISPTSTIGTSIAGKKKSNRARYKFQSDRNNEIFECPESSVNQPCFSPSSYSSTDSIGSTADWMVDDKENTLYVASPEIPEKQNGFHLDAGNQPRSSSSSLWGGIRNVQRTEKLVKVPPRKAIMKSVDSWESESDRYNDDEDVLVIGLSYEECAELL